MYWALVGWRGVERWQWSPSAPSAIFSTVSSRQAHRAEPLGDAEALVQPATALATPAALASRSGRPISWATRLYFSPTAGSLKRSTAGR